jgi:hypothetical protein
MHGAWLHATGRIKYEMLIFLVDDDDVGSDAVMDVKRRRRRKP